MTRTGARCATAAVTALLLMACASETAMAQCAMCRTALSSPEGQRLAAGLRGGILLLLAVPFTLFGIVATLVVRLERKRTAGSPGDADPIVGSGVRQGSSGPCSE